MRNCSINSTCNYYLVEFLHIPGGNFVTSKIIFGRTCNRKHNEINIIILLENNPSVQISGIFC